MDALRFTVGHKSLADEIADTTGFERTGWLEIVEFEEYATVILISKSTLTRGSGKHVKEKGIIHVYNVTINARHRELL